MIQSTSIKNSLTIYLNDDVKTHYAYMQLNVNGMSFPSSIADYI